MRTKEAFSWVRSYSSLGSVVVPAGVPVEYNSTNKAYYVKPTYFSNLLHQHDAIYHGCRVDPANVEGGEICGGCKHLNDKPRLHCALSGLNISGTLERSDLCKTHKLFQARE